MAVLLAGCADPARELMEDYSARVTRAADARSTAPEFPALPRYPSHRARQLPLIATRGSWLEILDFTRCGLGPLIGERNSILARTQPASRRLDYELRLRAGLARCAEQIANDPALDEDDETLLARIDELREAKRANLGPLWWWASYDSPEFGELYALGEPLTPGDDAAFAQARAAMETLLAVAAQLDAPRDAFDLAGLERAYQQLALSGFGGRWLRSAALVAGHLARATAALEHAHARPVCPQGRPTPDARILQTVFARYYAARVQPYLAQLTQSHARWRELDARLLHSQRVVPPPAFRAWHQDAFVSLPADLEQAARRHVEAWQAVLRQCGMSPQRPGPAAPAR